MGCKRLAAIGLTPLLFGLPAAAQYTGPGAPEVPKTVAEILEGSSGEPEVVLRGQLVRREGEESYVFSDGTGEIRVEIDDEDLPPQAIDHTTRVEIHGEVERDFMRSPEIEVERLSVVGG